MNLIHALNLAKKYSLSSIKKTKIRKTNLKVLIFRIKGHKLHLLNQHKQDSKCAKKNHRKEVIKLVVCLRFTYSYRSS